MPLKTHLDEQPTLNLTPMIDIVFLLIIFFMVGTKFTELERKIGLQVPEVADRGALTAAPERKVVNVYRDGTLSLDRSPVTLDQLTSQLAAARSQYAELGRIDPRRRARPVSTRGRGAQCVQAGRHRRTGNLRPPRSA